jgi:hypothetical protein
MTMLFASAALAGPAQMHKDYAGEEKENNRDAIAQKNLS